MAKFAQCLENDIESIQDMEDRLQGSYDCGHAIVICPLAADLEETICSDGCMADAI
jgi:hypothetical protein